MTSLERMYAFCQAVRYVESARIPGDIVECGVWRGGSMMLAARTLIEVGNADRHLWLYDTFEGMTEPTDRDVSFTGSSATELWQVRKSWCESPIDEVWTNMASTGFPSDRLELVKGKVEDTIPGRVPREIAVLRLDTDWYESTYHELRHLVPLMRAGSVLIVDDYGHWHGHREAIDKYLAEAKIPMLLQRTDHAGRMGILPRRHT
ncbi:MAG: class I SAM-dependent methyltransferase [Thermoleophilaceae bacterium]|nr:class I SAM-dependent methyltransferase [Thermoleophilaceae bacterium]